MPRYKIAPGIDPREAPLLTPGRTPHVCPNGHAMDEGYFYCPCCGAYRAPRSVIVTHFMSHATIDGVRIGIDADGYVTIPDADGVLDQLNVGRVGRNYDSKYGTPTNWFGHPGQGADRRSFRTRRDAIRYLLENFR